MKVSTIQRIPMRKSAFEKSTLRSNDSEQNANFFTEDPSIPMPKFDYSSELQTQKRISMTKGLLSVIAIFPYKRESKSEWEWIDVWFGIWQIFARRRNPRVRDIMSRLREKHLGRDELWSSCADMGKGASI
jgi:hypothetical protein